MDFSKIFTKVELKSYPDNLLQKDWSKRPCYHFYRGSEIDEENGVKATDLIYDFKCREDDVFLVTRPKSGTTWMQELAWLILNDYNFDYAKEIQLEERSPYIEMHYTFNDPPEEVTKVFKDLKSPRLLKSHRSLPLLPKELWSKKSKVICVVRDPKDALVSIYRFFNLIGLHQNLTVDQYVRSALASELATEDWVNFYTEFYALRNEPWIFYTSYEKMKNNLREVITELCHFLEKPINEEEMKKMLKHLSFEEMKNNPNVTNAIFCKRAAEINNTILNQEIKFVRKGIVGSYKDELQPETVQALENWIENALKPHNVTLKQLLLKE